jgi:ATP-dependent Clp protease ATP-binding subunit ClpC
MQLAREESVRLGTDYVGTEHLLLGLIRDGEGVAITVMKNLGVDLDDLSRELENAINPRGGMMTIGQMIPFTPKAKKVLEVAAQEARGMGHRYIGTEHLLLAFFKDNNSAAASALENAHIDYSQVREEIDRVLNAGRSTQDAGAPGLAEATVPGAGPGMARKKSKTPFLDHFGRDLTEMARAGKLDPIIGRAPEIERVIQILSRRKKNNPALIGEPGVGKTAIVEGLAQKIVQRDIPEILEDKRVVTLDMATVVAGTKYRGQFEERLKALMVELQKNDDVIIFIDELHTIVGAGGSEGSLDASNIFKPALSRGELQCIGATTLDEYRKYIEKDGALERRFQTIMVEPPTIEDTLEIMKGLRPKYEAHHKVAYTDAALKASVFLSERYMSERSLPDKAIDVVDEAGARVRLASMAIPPELRELEEKLEDIKKQKLDAANSQEFEKAARLRDEQESLKEKIDEKKEEWRNRKKEEELVVREDDIQDVIGKMTGIPVMRLAEAETKSLMKLEDDLRQRVIGQDKALLALAKAIRRSRAGIHSSRRPTGSFLFLGPTGVGKTELAKALTILLFGSEDAMIRVDMSEYMEKHSVSRLIGAPPGYVGYDDNGGQLSEKVRKKPYCVVLLDEIEKAHPDVFNILLQILDDGQLTDNYGRKVNFKNTIVIMTSNVGARMVKFSGGMGFTRDDEDAGHERLEAVIQEEVKKTFNPEFINRIDEMIVFRSLAKEDLIQVVEILLGDMQKRLHDRNITMEFDQDAKHLIVEHGFDAALGARPLRRSVQRLVEDELAEGFLTGDIRDNCHIKVSVQDQKLFFSPEFTPEPGQENATNEIDSLLDE